MSVVILGRCQFCTLASEDMRDQSGQLGFHVITHVCRLVPCVNFFGLFRFSLHSNMKLLLFPASRDAVQIVLLARHVWLHIFDHTEFLKPTKAVLRGQIYHGLEVSEGGR